MGDGTRDTAIPPHKEKSCSYYNEVQGENKVKVIPMWKKRDNLEEGTVLTGFKNGKIKQSLPLTVQALTVPKLMIRFKTLPNSATRTCHRILLMLKPDMGP